MLLPRSTLFPALALGFIAGFKENLKKNGVVDKIELLTDNIGFGVNEPEIYTKAEKMLLEKEVEVVILFADVRIAEVLQPLFTASNKILLVVNFGANFPDSWQPAPTTITHSLNFCFHTHLTGKLAANQPNKQAVNVVSYYDGGYRQCFSMLNGHQANGGLPLYNHITHIKIEEFTLQPVADFLEKNATAKTLLCLFAADEAERFYQDVLPLQKKFGLTLYVSPMLFEESLRNLKVMDRVKGYVPWHDFVTNEANQLFKETISLATNKPANYFSLLGWETGMIVTEIIQLHKEGQKNAAGVVHSLTAKIFDSPRGWLKIDATSQYSYGPAWLASCDSNNGITISKAVDSEVQWAEFTTKKLLIGESSSWRNTYLCI